MFVNKRYLESLASDPAWLRFGHHKNIQLIWLRNGWFITYLFIYIFTSKSAIQIMYIIRLDGVYIKNVHTKVKNWKRTILTWTFQNLYPCQISVALHSPWKVAPSLLQDQKVENCSEGEHLFQGRGFCQINGRVITSTRRRKMIYLMGFISASFANDKLEGGWKNTIGFWFSSSTILFSKSFTWISIWTFSLKTSLILLSNDDIRAAIFCSKEGWCK